MLDRVRDVLYRAMTASVGDSVAPLRIPIDLARRLNATLGRPLAPLSELEQRGRSRARLAELRAARGAGRPAAVATARPGVEAPILVYFEKDRNVRELTRIEELLGSRGYAWKRLDVTGDDSTIDFVLLKAGCKRDDLPVVFVADQAIGPFEALVRADVSGDLARAARP
jgi:hypothetical protein